MDQATLFALAGVAALIGVLHTLAGPDHYLPFVAMSRAGRWSLARTLTVTLAAGTGHVLGSAALGLAGVATGLAVGRLEWVEQFRGQLAGWLLLGFGLAYLVWGLRRAVRNRPHAHWHAHGDGTVHVHEHRHVGEHTHVHQDRPDVIRLTPWVLFTIFVFGPCEPLIPLLMYPAARGSFWGVALVTVVFGVCTLAAMTAAVAAGHLGLGRLPAPWLGRFGHAAAGLAVAACGAAVILGL